MPQLVLLRQIIANMDTVQIKKNSCENAARTIAQHVSQNTFAEKLHEKKTQESKHKI
jgi:hypothetical protein